MKSQWLNIIYIYSFLTQIPIWVGQSLLFIVIPLGICGPQDVEIGEERVEGMFLRDRPGID